MPHDKFVWLLDRRFSNPLYSVWYTEWVFAPNRLGLLTTKEDTPTFEYPLHNQKVS